MRHAQFSVHFSALFLPSGVAPQPNNLLLHYLLLATQNSRNHMHSSGYRIRLFIQFNHFQKDAGKRYFGMEIDIMKYALLKIFLTFIFSEFTPMAKILKMCITGSQ